MQATSSSTFSIERDSEKCETVIPIKHTICTGRCYKTDAIELPRKFRKYEERRTCVEDQLEERRVEFSCIDKRNSRKKTKKFPIVIVKSCKCLVIKKTPNYTRPKSDRPIVRHNGRRIREHRKALEELERKRIQRRRRRRRMRKERIRLRHQRHRNSTRRT